MNKQPKKVLLIDDDKFLLTIFSLYIKDLGHSLIEAVTSFKEAKFLFDKHKPDVVILDAGIENVKEISKTIFLEYDCPIIFLVGYNEEYNLQDVTDYGVYAFIVRPVNKFNLESTIPLVCWKHDFEQQKRLNEQLLHQLDFAVITMSLQGKIFFLNEAARLLFKKDESSSPYFYDWINYSYDDFNNFIVDELISKGFVTKNIVLNIENENRILQTNYSLLVDEINEPYAISLVITDYTEFNQLASGFIKTSAIKASLFNGINQMVFVFSKDSELLMYNNKAQLFYNQNFNILLSNKLFLSDILFFITNTELQSLQKNIFEGVYHFTERFIEKESKKYHLQISWLPVEIENKVEYFILLINDVTSLRNLEQELIEVKDELKPIFDSSIQRFYLVDLDLRLIAFNKSARDIIYKEFNRPLLKGENILNLVPHPDRQKLFLEKFELAKQGHSVSYKESYLLKNEIRWNEVHLSPVVDDRGEIKRILIWTLDVTEREQYLRDIKESQERYELIARGSNDGIFEWDIVKNTVYLSPRWKALLGYEDYELKNEFGVRDSLIHPDDKEKAQKVLDDYFMGIIPVYENEFRLRHKKGHYVWVIERGELLKDEFGNKIKFAGSITDITRLKNTEADLIKLNKTLLDERNMFMQGSVVITRVKADKSNKFIYISENVKDVLGYSVDEFISGLVTYDSLIHPDDLDFHRKEREAAVADKKMQISFTPYRMRKKDGNYIWIKDFSTIICNEDGTLDILGYFIDITEQKLYEEKLKSTNKRYVTLFDEASDAIILIDDLKIIEANKSAEKLFGYKKEQLIQMDILMLSPEYQPSKEKSIEKFNNKILNSLITQSSKAFYWQFLNSKKEFIDTEVGISPIVFNNKRICYQAIIRDITERKKLENAMKENERKVQAILESIPDLLFILDKDNRYIYFKPDKEKLFDIPHEQVIGKNLSDFFSGEILEKYNNCIKKCREKKQVVEIVYNMNSPQGIRKFEARLSLLPNNQILQIVRDLGSAE
jgi:PAS domain S-box-containing protein